MTNASKQALISWVMARGAIILLFAGAVCFTSLFFHEHLFKVVTAPHFTALEMLGYDRTDIVHVPKGYPPGLLGIWKIGLVCSLVLSFPLILIFLASLCWRVFREHERKPIRYFTPASLLLYGFACILGYCVLIPYTLYGLAFMSGITIPLPNAELSGQERRDVSPEGTLERDRVGMTPEDEDKMASHYLKYLYNLSHYLDLVLLLTMFLGAILQLPLIMAFLAKIGRIAPSRFIKRWWVGTIVIGFISIVLSPLRLSEVLITILFVFLPLFLLFLVGIGLSHMAWKTRCKPDTFITGQSMPSV